jgi:hypothetical protein
MKRNKFSLSHYKLLSCDMGHLVPIGLTEVLPGDTIQQSTSALVRVSPLVSPVMHPVNVRIHHWFVPHRLIWDEWEDFITGGPDGMSIPEFPTMSSTPVTGSLADYLGIPVGVLSEYSALPFRAYAMIFNEWYRDQDLVNPIPFSTESGPDTITNTLLQNVAWEKDYFTTCRPWTQKGPEITLPLGGQAPVFTTGTAGAFPNFGDSANSNNGYALQTQSGTLPVGVVLGTSQPGDRNVFADLSHATAITINDLREGFALQRYEEARARYGSRYTEYLRYLGVRSSDARLQRPEYLGGGQNTIQFSEVLATANDTDTSVGDLYGHGIGHSRSNRYRRFFEEHGYVLTFMSIKPKTMYTQGLPRTWNRRTKEDFFQKELQHIGQQEVYNKELYAASANPDAIFGYQDRYDEYRRHESCVAGEFRNLLDYWHYARIFATEPALNSDFITSVPTKRVYAEQTKNCLYVMAQHSIQARRMVDSSASSFIF